jgi:hypothetical protein
MSVMDRLTHAANKMAEQMSGDDSGSKADILDTLKQDHRDVAELLERLVDSDSATERNLLLASIRTALIPHLRAEERVVYEAVVGLRGNEQKQHGDEGYLEHDLADKMLATLGRVGNAMSPEFAAASKVLKELVEHHVKEEETHIWADVEDNFSDAERIAMNRKFLAAKSRVRVPSA